MPKLVPIFLICIAGYLYGCAEGTDQEPGSGYWSTSILDLRYRANEFVDKPVMFAGYFPTGSREPLWAYFSSETASRQSESYGIQLLVTTEDLHSIRDRCGAGYAFVFGHFLIPNSSGVGLVVAEKIFLHDQPVESDFEPCWVASDS